MTTAEHFIPKKAKIAANPWPHTVRNLRHAKNWNTRALADRVGVSHRTVEGWEQGRYLPSGPARKMLLALVEQV